ncbi:MAG: hypothetical protein L0H98_00480 [Lacticaseibacillus paracasei]|nr:hypothetical protein [Lacticaseibacillus paracasei]
MSNETKRDVFDELLKMYRNSMALTHEEPVILDNDGYDVFGKIEKSYAAASPDETDKQKNCPYCHNKYGLKISQDAYSFWYRNKRFKPLFCSNCGRKL